jgi:hypothetical protein
MFYTSIEEYVATMSDEEYTNLMIEAFADEMADAADAELGM